MPTSIKNSCGGYQVRKIRVNTGSVVSFYCFMLPCPIYVDECFLARIVDVGQISVHIGVEKREKYYVGLPGRSIV